MEIGNKTKNLSWKLKIGSAVLIGLVFASLLMLMDYLLDEELANPYKYLFQGTFFGFFMGIGFPFLFKKFEKGISSNLGKNLTPKLDELENIEIQGPANLFRGIEGVGGKLFLTNKKIIFKSHKINIQGGQTDIEYVNIESINKRKTAKLIDNGIRIITNDKKEFDFVVNDRDLWVKKMKERI